MDNDSKESDLHSYALSGKVMCFSVVALLALLFLVLYFYLYSRFLSRRSAAAESHTVQPIGLHPSLLKSLPTFNYSSGAHMQGLKSAVCLSVRRNADGSDLILVPVECRRKAPPSFGQEDFALRDPESGLVWMKR